VTKPARHLRGLISAAAELPLVRGAAAGAYRRHFNSVRGTARLFNGIYPDFASALRAIPVDSQVGYDNEPSAERMLGEWLAVHPSDYPVLFWLEKLLPAARSVFDWGGNVGIKYFAFRPYLTYPEDLVWIVNDVPAILKRGEEIARQESAPALRFTPHLDELARAGILLASGVVQFIEDPFVSLKRASATPEHLIFNKVPLYDGPGAVTLHNMGTSFCPYHLFNRKSFIASIEELGYELRDAWRSPGVSCGIPFFPEHAVDSYSGLYFAKAAGRRS
jgi:putative methyltransferase (TIGR04325 family)